MFMLNSCRYAWPRGTDEGRIQINPPQAPLSYLVKYEIF